MAQSPTAETRPATIDRRALRETLKASTKVLATIGAAKLIAFLKEQEFDLKLPAFVVRQGLRSLLHSKVDELCRLPDADLRNVLRLIDWHARLALGEVTADHLPMRPHDHPAVRASIEKAMAVIMKSDWVIDPADVRTEDDGRPSS